MTEPPRNPITDDLEVTVGHPLERWEAPQERVQSEGITRFAVVERGWLDLMWAMDAYRIAEVMPRGMGRREGDAAESFAGVYRNSKGNWFATLIALLLQNRTDQVILPRTRVRGFSQEHQIDVAWPARRLDPLVCIETKVTGAPAHGGTPARGAYSDWSNRRKELKFAATDLKLYRKQQETRISHWGVWREKAPPKTYFIWAARLRTGGRGRDDDVTKMTAEVRALTDSYLDGAGVVPWRARPDGRGYEPVALPVGATVAGLDDVLYRIESEIRDRLDASGKPPEPVRPDTEAVDVSQLLPDDE